MRILLVPLHHAIDTNLIQRLQDIHCRKKECTRTTGRIEDSNLLQRMIETSDKSMVIGRCKQIGYKRTNIQIIGDKIINLSNLAFRYLMQNRIAPLKPINGFTPYFCRQGPRFGSFVIPILTPFQQIRRGRIEAIRDAGRNARFPIGGVSLFYGVEDIFIPAHLKRLPDEAL